VTQAESGVTRRFKRGADGRSLGKEVVGRVGGGLDALGQLPLPAPTSAPWSGEGEVGLSLYLLEVAAAQITLQQGSLQMR
jgi:hypothetical protein